MTNLANRLGTNVMDPSQKSDYVRQLEAAASAIGSAGIQYVKFQKGYWLLGREGTPFPGNAFYFLPNLQNVTYGWQCWRNGQCVEDRWYSAGERLPEKTALPDHGPYSKQNDGWQRSVKLDMIVLPDQNAPVQEAILGMFVSSSSGGLNAVSKLLRDFANGLKTGRLANDQIIVHASSDKYDHKQYGPTAFPVFTLTEWLTEPEAFGLLESFGVSLPPTVAPVQHMPAPAAPAPVAQAQPTRRFGSQPLVQQPGQPAPAYAPPQQPAPAYAPPQQGYQPPAPTPPWEGPVTIDQPPQPVAPVAPAPGAQRYGAAPAQPAVIQPAAPPVRRFVAAGQPAPVQPAPVQPAWAPPPVQPIPPGPAPTGAVQYGQPPAPAPVAAPAPAPAPLAPPPVAADPGPAQAVARRGHPRRPPAAAPSGAPQPGTNAAVDGAGVDAALGDGSV